MFYEFKLISKLQWIKINELKHKVHTTVAWFTSFRVYLKSMKIICWSLHVLSRDDPNKGQYGTGSPTMALNSAQTPNQPFNVTVFYIPPCTSDWDLTLPIRYTALLKLQWRSTLHWLATANTLPPATLPAFVWVLCSIAWANTLLNSYSNGITLLVPILWTSLDGRNGLLLGEAEAAQNLEQCSHMTTRKNI